MQENLDIFVATASHWYEEAAHNTSKKLPTTEPAQKNTDFLRGESPDDKNAKRTPAREAKLLPWALYYEAIRGPLRSANLPPRERVLPVNRNCQSSKTGGQRVGRGEWPLAPVPAPSSTHSSTQCFIPHSVERGCVSPICKQDLWEIREAAPDFMWLSQHLYLYHISHRRDPYKLTPASNRFKSFI